MSLAIRKMPLGLHFPSARLAWIVTALLLLLGTATAAYGFWASITSSSNAAAASDVLAPGSRPAVSATGTAVSVTWAGGTTVNGHAATGYTVSRYASESGGTGTAATGGCAGTVTMLTCTEQNVPGGTWYYTVTPAISLWTGAESPRSTGISSDSAAPTVSVSPLSPAPNAAGWNNTSPVTFTITADDGASGSGVASITYTLDGGAQQTVSSASATVTVSGDGTHTVSYFATDKVGNTGAAQTQTVRIDTTAPAAPVFTTVPPYVFSGNVNAVILKGTAESGTKIALTASDAGAVHSAPPATATADGTGNWTASMNLSSLDQGSVTYWAVATDVAGNTSTGRTATNIKDTVAPDPAQSVVVPQYVNSATKSDVLVEGTAEVGARVTVTANTPGSSQPTNAPSVVSTAEGWSVRMDLKDLKDGTVTYTVTVTDAAGNTTPATLGSTSLKDTVAPAPTITPLSFFINSSNANALRVEGTTEAGAVVDLTVRASVTQSITKRFTSADTGWSTTVDLTSLPEGTLTFTAASTDAAGNSGTASATSTLDTIAPKVTGIFLKPGGPVPGKADAGDTVTIEFSEALDPGKICPAQWSSTNLATNMETKTLAANNDVTVTITHSTSGTTTNNTLTVASKVCALNIGSISLGANAKYAATAAAVDFGGVSTGATPNGASTLTWNPNVNPKVLTIKLGEAKNKTGAQGTGVPFDTPIYTPAANLADLAGNPLGTAGYTGTLSGF